MAWCASASAMPLVAWDVCDGHVLTGTVTPKRRRESCPGRRAGGQVWGCGAHQRCQRHGEGAEAGERRLARDPTPQGKAKSCSED